MGLSKLNKMLKTIKNKAFLSLFIPLFSCCQSSQVPVVKVEEVSSPIGEELCGKRGAYFTSGQFDQNGFGVLDLQSNFFFFQKEIGGACDSLPIPENRGVNFYNVVPNPNGNYYFLDPDLGLYLLTKEKPVFLDSINKNPVLLKNGLMVSNILSTFEFASFSDKEHLIIPICWNYLHPQGKYWNKKKPVPMFCEYNIKTRAVRLLHCMTPKEIFKQDYANRERRYFAAINGDSLMMSMPQKSEVVIYSISQDKEIGRVDCKSTFHTEKIKQFGLTGKKRGELKLDRYEIETPFYGTMFYNKERKEYYRIFYHGLPERNEKGEYTIYFDKKSSVIVMDEKLRIQKEILFDNNAYIIFGITSTKKGFVLNAYEQKIKDTYTNVEVLL